MQQTGTGPVIDGWVNLPIYSEQEVRADPTLMELVRFFGRGPEMLASRPVESLLDEMTEAGIDRGVLSATPLGRAGGNKFGPLTVDAEQGIDFCERSGGRLKLSLFVDDVSVITRQTRMIRELVAGGQLVMVRVVPSAHDVPIDDRRLYHVYGTCEELGLPISINVGVYGPHGRSKNQDPMMIEDVMLDFPGLSVIGAHMGHPWEQLLIRLLMKYENLSLMTSAYSPKYIVPEMLRFMDSSRGRGKLMFATDYPVLRLDRAVTEARKLPLSPESVDAYLGGNLARLLKWD